MKKIIFVISALSLSVGGYIGSKTVFQAENSSTVRLSNIESLAGDCEVFDGGRKLIKRCRGEASVCWRSGNFYCSGTEVK